MLKARKMTMINEGETLQQIMSGLRKRCGMTANKFRKAVANKLGTTVSGLAKFDDETVAQAGYRVAIANNLVH